MEISNTDLPLTVLGSGISHSFIFAQPQSCCVTWQGPRGATVPRYISQANSTHPALACPCPKYPRAHAHSQVIPTALRQLFHLGKKRGIVQEKVGVGEVEGCLRHPLLRPTRPSLIGTGGGDVLLLLTWKHQNKPG